MEGPTKRAGGVASPLRLHRFIPQRDVRKLVWRHLTVHDMKIVWAAHKGGKYSTRDGTYYDDMLYFAAQGYMELVEWCLRCTPNNELLLHDMAYECVVWDRVALFDMLLRPHATNNETVVALLHTAVANNRVQAVKYFAAMPQCFFGRDACAKWRNPALVSYDHMAVCRSCFVRDALLCMASRAIRSELNEIFR